MHPQNKSSAKLSKYSAIAFFSSGVFLQFLQTGRLTSGFIAGVSPSKLFLQTKQ